ncbi:MAG TPA: hypothetical protein VMW41_01370 [Candidatus Bathyarchaeia archaeon]|nr:hypothetical protein [Candidatus Bathyarchaeia archaeon]
MIDFTQAILVMVVTTITVLLIVVGIQVYNILKEFQETIKRANKILDDIGTVSESIAKPISSAADILTGATGITGLLGWLVSRKKKEKGKKDE